MISYPFQSLQVQKLLFYTKWNCALGFQYFKSQSIANIHNQGPSYIATVVELELHRASVAFDHLAV